VGTVKGARRHADRRPVHPHARGDSLNRLADVRLLHGSPPRAWGQCVARMHRAYPVRFTPTRVGTVLPAKSAPAPAEVHPHARGDSLLAAAHCRATYGSPPRAWGQSRVGGVGGRRVRFTPTRVGTVPPPRSRRPAAAVHPHARGDSCEMATTGTRNCGSPPRAWGQCGRRPHHRIDQRFTPTRVGTVP